MFNRNTCAVAVNVATSLQSRHIKIVPASREMGVLIEQVIYPISQAGVTWDNDNVADLVKTMSLHDMGDETAAGDQEQAIAEYIQQMAATLKTNLNLTRRVAIPLIEKTFNEVQTRLNELKLSHYDKMMYDINICGEYSVMDNPMFSDMVMKFSDSNFSDAPNTARLLGPMTEEDLYALAQTGSAEFDKQMQTSLLTGGPQAGHPFVVAIWNKHFLHPESAATMSTVKSVASRGDDFREWGAAFLLANALVTSDVPDGVSVDLETFKSVMNRYRAYCGYHVQRLIKNYTAKRATGMLVIDDYVNQHGVNVLVVVEDTYKKAEEAGITSEVIMGYKMGGGTSWFLDTIIQSKETSLRTFQEAMSQQAVALQLAGRKVLRDAVLENIQDFSKTSAVIDDAGTTIKTSPSVESIAQHMTSITREIEDIYNPASVLKYIQDTITNGLFAGTMVSIIVSRMDVFMDVNDYSDAVDVRHAGLMAAMSICVESLLSQFTIDLCLDK